MSTTVYGIKNCDTMKKAIKWLDEHGVDYVFHDYKKQGLADAALRQAIAAHGWDNALNRRGTTWRALPDDVKTQMNDEEAVRIAQDNPSIVKRPLLAHAGKTYLGFKDADYAALFDV